MFIEFFRPSRRESPIPPRMAFLAMVRTGPEWPVIREMRSFTVASSCASGTRRFTMPSSSARSAETGSPSRTSSRATFGPTRNGRIVEASGGKTPMVISGWAKRAFGRVFADVNAARKNFARRIEDDQLHVLALGHMAYTVGDFAQKRGVEEIVLRAAQCHTSD